MTSLIGNCLGRLVKAGRITQRQADDALGLAEGMQERLYPHMPPTSAQAASALEAARAMAAAAKERKLMYAMQAIRDSENSQRMIAHPKGQVAGLMGILTRDIWDHGGLNVESHAESVLGSLMRGAGKFVEPYRSKAAGMVQDVAGVRKVIYELFGRDTGDNTAKEAARAWTAAVDAGVKRAKAAGRVFNVLEDWRTPQFWDQGRVKANRQDFVNDLLAAHSAGALRMIDGATGENATPIKALAIAERAAEDISLGISPGARARGFSSDMRVFRFDDPDAWLKFADKYGAGRGGIYGMMEGHLNGMAKDIALSEVLGPSYGANFSKLMEQAQRWQAGATKAEAGRARFLVGESLPAAQRTYDLLTGKLGSVQSEMLAGVMGGLRSLRTASTLGSAIISAVPGDSVTAIWASRWNGIPATAVVARAASEILADSEAKRELASQLNIVAHAVMDSAIGAKRFEDSLVGENLPARLASFVIRAQGLQAWTEGLKRAFMMEFNGYIARQSDQAWTGLEKPMRNFLKRYGFTPTEWDELRATPPMEAEGARFFDVNGVANRRLGDRLMSAMIDERRFAVIEPDARVRQATTFGQRRGTILGELARSGFLFKSFSMSVIMTHMLRYALTGNMAQRGTRLAGFLTTMTVAGAASMQAKNIIAGRDPQDMRDPKFWGSALAQGGGLGIYGDLVSSSVTREQYGLGQTLAGPVVPEVIGTVNAAINAPGKIARGEDLHTGRGLARFLKLWTPGSSLWYARIAADRLLFDQIYRLADPVDAQTSAARLEQYYRKQNAGQEFWWRPGETSPDRPPNVGAALPH